MSFLSDLSRKLGFTSGEDDREELEDGEYSEEDEFEEDEPEDEERGGFRIPNPFRGRAAQRVSEDEEGDGEEEPVQRTTKRGNVIHDSRMESRAQGNAQATSSAYSHREWIYDVRSMEDCRYIIQYLLAGDSVLLNLENVDNKVCSRVVDLLSGAAFALQGRLVKVAHLSYLLAPHNVNVGDAAAELAAQRAGYRRPTDG